MEAKKMTHEEYLRKYIIGDEKKKKVKKKRSDVPTKKPIGMKIIDDDVDIKTIAANNEDIVDECGDEAPLVAEIIDERPLKSRLQDQYKPSSWKRVGHDDDDEENALKDMLDKRDIRKVTSPESVNSSRMRHDSDSDLSPERITEKSSKVHKNSKSKYPKSTEDFSPPRKSNTQSARHDSDSDLSPVRTDGKVRKSPENHKYKTMHISSNANFRPSRSNDNVHSTRHDSDGDLSPVRTTDKRQSSRNHKGKIADSDSDFSPPRNYNTHSTHRDSDSGISSSRAKSLKSADKISYHSNKSIPSHKKHDLKRTNSDSNSSRQKSRHDSDSDLSLPRQVSDSDSDLSVPRSSKNKYETDTSKRIMDSNKGKKKSNSSRDLSPKQVVKSKKHSDYDTSVDHQRTYSEKNSKYYSKAESQRNISPSTRKRRHSSSDGSESSAIKRFDSNSSNNSKGERNRPSTTLSGLKAGLQNSSVVREEAEKLRKRESKHIKEMDEELSGRNAQTIYRDRETGKKRDLKKEQESKDEEDKEKAKKKEKYSKWGKGLEQGEQQLKKFEDDAYEMTKPLARYKDDEDLDKELRSKVYEEDPMFEYIQKKRKKQDNVPDFPKYSGPAPPPNRFNIQPGYRWDGVDRSIGFEKRYFDNISAAKAKEIESHLWSVQDM